MAKSPVKPPAKRRRYKQGEVRAPRGRQTLYTPAIAAEICARLGHGETLQDICRTPGMPSVSTVNSWTEECRPKDVPATFAPDFARARVLGFDAIAAQTLEIADDARNDWMERAAQEGGGEPVRTFNAEHVQRSKLRIETRLKLLAKWDPKRYGERMALEVEDVTDRAEQMRQRRAERLGKT